MLLRLKVKSANLCLSADGEDTRFELRLDCSPADASGVLEIGDRYVFANRAKRSIFSIRRSCELLVWVKRRSSLTNENIEKIGLSDCKIGELCFVPGVSKDDLSPSVLAALDARVFVSDEVFELLLSTFQAGREAKWLDLEIEKKGVLQYGWEPDGSRMEWKLESATEVSYVDVEQVDIGMELFR
jgi:hypothetical protein